MSGKRWGVMVLVVAVLVAATSLGAGAQPLTALAPLAPLAALGVPSQALPPAGETAGTTVPYPGRLSNTAGQPVADGAYELRFALYAAATGGQPLWTETQTGVTVRGGAFSVALGSAVPLPKAVLDGGSRWLEVSVRGPGEASFTALEPRQGVRLAASAAARQAASCAHDHGGERWEVYDTWSAGLTIILQDPAITNPSGVYASDGTSYTVMPISSGVTGVSGAGAGVGGRSSSGYGLYGMSSSGNGVRGESSGAGSTGVYGLGGLKGVYGESSGVGSTGVYGLGETGVVGKSNTAGSNGVFGENTSNGIGVTGTSASGFGMQAGGLDTSYWDTWGDILLGGNYGEIFASGILLNLYSNRHIWLHLDNDNNDAQSTFRIYKGDDTVLWEMAEPTGNVVAAGSQASAVATTDYGHRLLYAVEGTGVWLEDVGTAALGKGGEVTVAFDPMYAQAANVKQNYQVFVTPLGEEFVLLQVTAKTATGFTVRGVTLDGKPAACSFDYRVVAPRAGYEAERMESVELDGQDQP